MIEEGGKGREEETHTVRSYVGGANENRLIPPPPPPHGSLSDLLHAYIRSSLFLPPFNGLSLRQCGNIVLFPIPVYLFCGCSAGGQT